MIAFEIKCFYFFYKKLFTEMLRLIVGLTLDGWPLNLMNFSWSQHQLKQLATKVTMVTKVSFKIWKYIICILPKCLFEVWHKNNDGFRTVIIEFHKIWLLQYQNDNCLPFSFFIKHENSGSSYIIIEPFLCHIWLK